MENNEDKMNIFSDVPAIEDVDGIFNETQEEVIEETESKEETTSDPTPEEGQLEESVGSEQAEVEENNESSESGDGNSPSLFSSLAALLQDKGLISSDLSDDEIDEDKFVDLVKNEIKKNELSDLTDVQKQYLNDLRDGIPEETIKQEINQTSQLESITDEQIESDENLRKTIIYNDFINRGYSQERAVKLTNRSIQAEADLEDAKEALASIKEFTKSKFETEKQKVRDAKDAEEKQKEKYVNSVKDKISKTEEIIKGYKISDTVKEQVEKTMFDIVGKDPEGNEENSLMKYARENKEDFDLKLYYLYTITKGFQDFSIIEKSKNSKIVSNLEKAMRSTTRIKDVNKPTYLQDPDSYQGFDWSNHELVTD